MWGAITVSTTSADCLNAAALAQSHENLWCSAGVHPLHSDEPVNWDDVVTAAQAPKCVAWGELGLDNHYTDPPRSQQLKILEEQLAVIERAETKFHSDSGNGKNESHRQRPIILHCRKAYDELLAILRTTAFDPSRFVFHCFTGTADDARKVLNFGAWISFTGIVTFANASDVAEAARLVPADRIMVETDSPFLTPEPMRKVRPNEPKYVVHVARRLAELRKVDARVFEQQLDANAQRFFQLPELATSL